jgi:RNA polymerase sigma-70 factor (ECF subfamily)
MNEHDQASRISRITTIWTMVQQAHQGAADEVTEAQQALLERYSEAIYRYLLAALREPDAADEVFQEFALRFVRGYFRNADPERGRFRDFVKKSLYHLILDHRKKAGSQPRQFGEDHQDPAVVDSDLHALDEEFAQRWREELLTRTWEALARHQEKTGQPFHSVLTLRAGNPQHPASALAESLSSELGRPITEVGVRQLLHRAREKFADLLLDEVACSLQTTAQDQLEDELVALNLLSYCRTAFERRARKS